MRIRNLFVLASGILDGKIRIRDPGSTPDPKHWWNDGGISLTYYYCLPVRACWRATQWASVGVSSAPSSPPSTLSTGSSGHPASTSILGTVPMLGKIQNRRGTFSQKARPIFFIIYKNSTSKPLEFDVFSLMTYSSVYVKFLGCILLFMLCFWDAWSRIR